MKGDYGILSEDSFMQDKEIRRKMQGTYPKKKDIKRMRNLYGENRIIDGSFDEDCAARCANGVFVGRNREGVLSFKGIPFAKPPVGDLRWKAPEEPDPSAEVREAFFFGKSPVQAPWYSELASCYPTGEDCLYLNVWTAGDRSEKKPVMVFIHGGAYGYGGTADPIYDGQNFVKAHPDVILVTIAYRVGVMGFVDFSEVEGSEGYEDSCNLGLLDQIRALHWIRDNISSFGGDPDNVTLFGESAGGGSVSILPVMPAAKGLFRRVIAESGSIALTYSRKEAKPFTRLFMKETGARNMQDLLALSEDEIYKANLPINEKNNFPVRDGRIVPEDLYAAYERGDSAWAEMLCGTNKDETRYWIGEMGGLEIYAPAIPILFENQCRLFDSDDRKRAKEYYRHGEGEVWWRLTEFQNDIIFRVPAQKQLELHAKNGGKAYHYFWSFPSALKHYGACHAVELSSVFNNPQEKIYTGDSYSPELAAEVQQMWVNFAKYGDPSTDAHFWPVYSEDSRKTMELGTDIHVRENLYSRRTAIIERLLKYQINGNYGELDYSVPYVKVMAAALLLAAASLLILIIGASRHGRN